MTNLLISILIVICSIKYIIFAINILPLKLWVHSRKTKKEITLNNSKIKEPSILKTTSKIKKIIGNYFLSYYRYSVIQTGLIPSHSIRNYLYKNIFLVQAEKNCVIYYGAELRGSWNLKIGTGSIIGDKCILDARCGITIGKNVNISSNVSMWTEQHDYNDTYFEITDTKHGQIIIKDRVWIGPNVIILHNVTIGEGAVVGAGAVVTKDIEPFTVYAGIPAKKIGERNRNLLYEFDSKNRGLFY